MTINIIPITNIREAKAPNHTFIAESAATQAQALDALKAKYPWFDTSGGWGYWLETPHGGSLWVAADWQRKMP